MGHDELIDRTLGAAEQLTVEEASNAFIASLSTRWLLLRPFLPSLVVANSLPRHSFEPTATPAAGQTGVGPCAVCNTWCRPHVTIDRNILSFERLKWGGVRHLDLPFVWFCLDRLLAEGGAEPTSDDLVAMRSLLSVLREAQPEASLTQAEALIRLPKSNRNERLVVLESLSVVGVLEDPEHPGFLHGFPRTINRQLPNRRFIDRGYPGEWWTGGCGVNDAAVATLFPQIS